MTRKLMSELLGTFFLVSATVGTGATMERLAVSDNAFSLLCMAMSVGAVLAVMILLFESTSGAHFNPAVTLSFAVRKEIAWSTAGMYAVAQIAGGILSIFAVHLMFGLPMVELSTTARLGGGIWVGEFIATVGLIGTILCCAKHRPEALPFAVGLYMFAGHFFTSSGAFANPAVTIARVLTDTMTGIAASSALIFIVAQLAAAVLVVVFLRWLHEEE